MAKDLYHDQVKAALQKEGWLITHDPYELRVGGVEMYSKVRMHPRFAIQKLQLRLKASLIHSCWQRRQSALDAHLVK